MRLTLTSKEKKEIIKNGVIQIKRTCYLLAPNDSLVFGMGNKQMFDKIAYKWVYGDTDRYIKEMAKEGRRGIDYIHGKDKDRNIWNGAKWYEFNGVIDEFGELGKVFHSGKINKLSYYVSGFNVSLSPKDNTEYLNIILDMTVTKLNNTK